MPTFPESSTRKPLYGYDSTPRENVKRTEAEAGNSYARDSWGIARFEASMEFLLTRTDAEILWYWWEVNRALSFTFYDFEWTQIGNFASGYGANYQIGTGTGAAVRFPLPGKETNAGWTAFVNDVLATPTLEAGTGPNGEDQLLFTVAPASGATIKVSARLRRKYTCEFAETPKRTSIGWNRIQISMRVREKLPRAA